MGQKKWRFRLHKTETPGLYKSHLFFSNKTNLQYFCLLYREERRFEIYQANPLRRVYKSRKIDWLDNLQRLLKARLIKLGIDLFDETKRTKYQYKTLTKKNRWRIKR